MTDQLCNCYNKPPTVPTFRGTFDHLADCPAFGKHAIPVGIVIGHVDTPTTREQRPSNQCDVSASEPTSYVVEGNTYRELIAERDRLRIHLRQKSEQITRLQDGIEKMQQGSAERIAHEPPVDPLPDETRAATSRRAHGTDDAGSPGPTPPPLLARPLNEWHEDMGDVVWWKFPVDEPAWIGSPLASDWPGYHTHWTPHPAVPEAIRYSTATKSAEGG